MPTTEKHLRLELSLPDSGFSVNVLLEQVKVLPTRAGSMLLEAYQEQVLASVLGQPWIPQQPQDAPWACPKCGSHKGFRRRGSRTRRLRTGYGLLVFELRQVTCLACRASGKNATFSPFTALLGISPNARVSEELLLKGVDAATRLSYQQSSEVLQVMTGQNLSPTRIFREVQKRAQDIEFDVPEDAPILLLDSTKVKAGHKKTGVDLNAVLAVSDVVQDGKRSVLKKHLIGLEVGDWTAMKERLGRLRPRLILVDGDAELEYLAEELFPEVPRQRCLWHLPRTLSYNLWRENAPKLVREALLTHLRRILHTSTPVDQARADLLGLATDLNRAGYPAAGQLLSKAAETAFTHRTLSGPLPGGRQTRQAPIATSYIEREMREIDRRVDNGARWTTSGVLNLLRLRAVRRLSSDQWKALWAC